MHLLAIPMKPITAYSGKYFVILVIIVVLAYILAKLSNSLRIPSTVICGVSGTALLIMEIIKQPLLTYVRGSYSWSDLPFQLCSIPMYLCFVYLVRPTKRPAIAMYLHSFGLIGAIAAFAFPYSCLYGYLLLTIQSLAWHGILLFLGMYFLLTTRNTSDLKRIRAKENKTATQAVLIYAGAACIAVLINICLLKISNGTCNMFFFGPGNPDIPILNIIKEKYGWIVECIVMAIATITAGITLMKVQSYFRTQTQL